MSTATLMLYAYDGPSVLMKAQGLQSIDFKGQLRTDFAGSRSACQIKLPVRPLLDQAPKYLAVFFLPDIPDVPIENNQIKLEWIGHFGCLKECPARVAKFFREERGCQDSTIVALFSFVVNGRQHCWISQVWGRPGDYPYLVCCDEI